MVLTIFSFSNRQTFIVLSLLELAKNLLLLLKQTEFTLSECALIFKLGTNCLKIISYFFKSY